MSDNSRARSGHEALETSLDRVRSALAGLSYGTVTITVHESRVVQIDITEKTRL